MHEFWIRLKEWWRNLANREKKIIVIGVFFLTIIFFYQIIWSPVLHHLIKMRSHILDEQKILVLIQNADKEIQLAQNQNKKEFSSPLFLLEFLQQQVDEAEMKVYLTQLKQEGEQSVAVSFKKIEFDTLLHFLIKLSKQHYIAISQANIRGDKTLGQVDADLILR